MTHGHKDTRRITKEKPVGKSTIRKKFMDFFGKTALVACGFLAPACIGSRQPTGTETVVSVHRTAYWTCGTHLAINDMSVPTRYQINEPVREKRGMLPNLDADSIVPILDSMSFKEIDALLRSLTGERQYRKEHPTIGQAPGPAVPAEDATATVTVQDTYKVWAIGAPRKPELPKREQTATD